MLPTPTTSPVSFFFRLKPFLLRDRIFFFFLMFPGEIRETVYIAYEPPTLFFKIKMVVIFTVILNL